MEEIKMNNKDKEKGERITEKLDKIIEALEDEKLKKKEKKLIKFPRLPSYKLRKNYVIVILLKTNKQIDVTALPIEDGMIYLKQNKTFHLATTDVVLRYKNYPVIILPEWDLQPLSVDELMGKAIEQNRLALPQKIIIQAMKQAQLQPKKKLNIGIILIIIGIIAVGFFLLSKLKKT